MSGFTVTNLTDQELLDKVTELQHKLVLANRMSFSAVPQIQTMIEQCLVEMRERQEKKIFEFRFGHMPDSKCITVGGEEEVAKTEKKEEAIEKVGLRMRRSMRPVNND